MVQADLQLRALWGGAGARHRPGRRLRLRPAFPLARPRPASSRNSASMIRSPFTDIENRPAGLPALCPSEPSFIHGDAFSRPWTGSAPSREDQAANKIPPPISHAGRPTLDHHRTPVWARGEGLPTASVSRKGPTQKHTGKSEAPLCLAPQSQVCASFK